MQPELLDLLKVVGNMSKMLERLLGETIALEFQPAVENSFVLGDCGMIEQVVMNLSINARDAMPRGGRLTIGIETVELLGTRYTLDTVRALNRLYPQARFVWLMGADILPQLEHWAGWRDLFAAIPIAAFARPGWSYAALQSAAPATFARYRLKAEQARTLASCEAPAWCFIPSRLDPHSATAIRAVRPRRIPPKGKTISDKNTPEARTLPDRGKASAAQLALVKQSLEDDKAEDIAVIDLKGKSAFADYMVIASGRSTRQVVAIAEHLADRLKQAGHGYSPVEGKQVGDWVLVDGGDVVVHIFRPEARTFYALEKMWALEADSAKPTKPPRRRGDAKLKRAPAKRPAARTAP